MEKSKKEIMMEKSKKEIMMEKSKKEIMMEKSKYVWYLSYGSNLNEDRFLCYIKGGTPKNGKRCQQGCHDNTDPIKNITYTIPNRLYFGSKSKMWGGGGMAFITPYPTEKWTICRMYLITEEQFIDVVKQENRLDVDEPLDLDLSEVVKSGSKKIYDKGYNLILKVGEMDGYPIFTFTSHKVLWERRPSNAYVNMIKSGLEFASHSLMMPADYFYKRVTYGLKNKLYHFFKERYTKFIECDPDWINHG